MGIREESAGKYRMMSTASWPTERWTAAVVLLALALLILIRMGFRGINVMGASVSVK
jgi:hypothetical protein